MQRIGVSALALAAGLSAAHPVRAQTPPEAPPQQAPSDGLAIEVVGNVADSVYELRTGEGVGVGAPQYGMRRAFFVTLAQKF